MLRTTKMGYLQGGQGMVYSNALMRRMDDRWLKCMVHSDEDTCLGRCLHDNNVTMLHDQAFYCERFKPGFWDTLSEQSEGEILRQTGARVSLHAIYTPQEYNTLYKIFYSSRPADCTLSGAPRTNRTKARGHGR